MGIALLGDDSSSMKASHCNESMVPMDQGRVQICLKCGVSFLSQEVKFDSKIKSRYNKQNNQPMIYSMKRKQSHKDELVHDIEKLTGGKVTS